MRFEDITFIKNNLINDHFFFTQKKKKIDEILLFSIILEKIFANKIVKIIFTINM